MRHAFHHGQAVRLRGAAINHDLLWVQKSNEHYTDFYYDRDRKRTGNAMTECLEPIEVIACWPSGDSKNCSTQFAGTLDEAGATGWCIGHFDGQAYYVCPDHKETVWDPTPLRS